MTTQRDPETILAAWLDEGPTDLPDVTRRAILSALPTTAQARRGLIAPWRFAGMHISGRLAAPVLLGLAIAGLGWAVLGGVGNPHPVPTGTAPSVAPATPTAAPPSTSVALVCTHQLVPTLLLDVGCTYESTVFAHPLTITLADPWLVGVEDGNAVTFRGYAPAVQNAEVNLIYLADLVDGGCLGATTPPPSVPLPRTAAEYAAWLHLAVPTAVGPVSATVGGLPAMQFTIPSPDANCQAITLGSTAGPTQFSTYVQCLDGPCTLFVVDDGGRVLLIGTAVRPFLPVSDPRAAERFLGGLRFAP